MDGFDKDLQHDLETAASAAGRQQKPKVLTLELDVTGCASVAKAADEIRKAFGKLDILINNAGYMTPALPVTESDKHSWWRTFEVNLKGVYLVAQAFLPILMQTQDGLKTMVNINSVASHNLRVNASAYGTSKWAVLKLTEFMLVELAGEGLLAYSIHPGGIMTRLAEAMPQETHAGEKLCSEPIMLIVVHVGIHIDKGLTFPVWAALTDKPELTGDTIAFLTQERRTWLAWRYLSCTWAMEELLGREGELSETEKLKVRLVL